MWNVLKMPVAVQPCTIGTLNRWRGPKPAIGGQGMGELGNPGIQSPISPAHLPRIRASFRSTVEVTHPSRVAISSLV